MTAAGQQRGTALAMAVAVRGGLVPGVIVHTDRGSEPGRSRQRAVGCPTASRWAGLGPALDSAMIESGHSTVEFELRRIERFASKAAARATVAAWIEDDDTTRTRRWACAARWPARKRWAAASQEAA